MRFYFPDSQDQIDPSFDFAAEERSPSGSASAMTYTPTRFSTLPVFGDADFEGDRRRRQRRRR